MKVLFYEPFAINTPHFERSLELIQRHLDDGDEVVFLGCNGELSTCDVNWSHNNFICKSCIHRQQQGLSLIDPAIKSVSFLKLDDDQKSIVKKRSSKVYTHIDQLKEERYLDFDFGFATASSLISATRNANPDMKKHSETVQKLIASTLNVYFSMLNHLENEKADRIYLFNGRFAVLRPAMRAATKLGIDFYIHEVGATIDKFNLYKNAMPHDIKNRTQDIVDLWEQADPSTREKIGASFYEDQMKGKVTDPKYHHTKNQTQGMLPDNWDNSKHNICIFNSSEDEFSAIGDEWKLPFYNSQTDGIQQLVASLAKHQKEVNVYLRIHPNMGNMKGDTVEKLQQIKSDNFRVILPDSPISTYEMVRSSDKVVTFLSSVGIEAAFRNKPVILLGNNFYKSLGSTYNPTSHHEAIQFLLDKTLAPKDKTGALIYGYYRKMSGVPYKYYKAETLFKGKFKGTTIEAPWLANNLGTVFKKIAKVKSGLK